MELSDRELATLIWILIGISIALRSKVIREGIWRVMRALLTSNLRKLLLISFFYTLAASYLLFLVKIATVDNAKTIALWFATFALPSLAQTISKEEDRSHLATTREAIGANALIAFIVSIYTFNFLIELFLVPIAITLAILVAIPSDKTPKFVARFVSYSMLIIGIAMILKAAHGAFFDFDRFATLDTGREFVAPIALTFLYLPFLFSLHLYVVYENGAIRAKFSIKDKGLYRYAILKSTLLFNMDATGFKKWLKYIAHFEPRNRQDIDESIRRIKRVRRRDFNPFRVPPKHGWLPETAKALLKDEDLLADDYYQHHGGWSASSKYRKVGNGLTYSTLAYFIRGNEYTVKELALELTVFTDSDEVDPLEIFRKVAGKLICRAAYGRNAKQEDVSLNLDGVPLAIGNVNVTCTKERWKTGSGGYELTLVIEPREVKSID